MEEIRIFTDGGSRGNPGPSALGVYIEDFIGKPLAQIGKTLGVNTNNYAEYKAVIEGLIWVGENQQSLPQNARILFYMDSLLVCSQMKGIYRVKNPQIRLLFEEAKRKEAQISLPISYSHIPREKNKNADRLVNAALDNAL